MKVSAPKETCIRTKAKALLPLEEDPELCKLDKTNSVSWDLRSTPRSADSPTCQHQVRVLQGTKTPRQIIRWPLDVQKVVVGLPVTTAATQRPVMEACVRPGPLAIFGGRVESMAQAAFDAGPPATLAADVTAGNNDWERAYRLAGNNAHIDKDMLKTALDLVVANFLPHKSLARVKRSMRWDMQKPAEMKVRQHVLCLICLKNNESPNLPPFQANQKLPEDKVLDIMLFGTPRSWQNKME